MSSIKEDIGDNLFGSSIFRNYVGNPCDCPSYSQRAKKYAQILQKMKKE